MRLTTIRASFLQKKAHVVNNKKIFIQQTRLKPSAEIAKRRKKEVEAEEDSPFDRMRALAAEATPKPTRCGDGAALQICPITRSLRHEGILVRGYTKRRQRSRARRYEQGARMRISKMGCRLFQRRQGSYTLYISLFSE